MRITPLDVRKQEFRKAVRGFDCDEVRAFLNTLADEYELVLVDNKQLRERVMDQDEKITEYKSMERTLRDTLMTAERLMQETRENANKEGDLIVRDAQMKAKQVLQECRVRTEELRRELVSLRKEKENYLARFKGLADAQIQFISSHRNDFEDLDKRLVNMVDSVIADVQANVEAVEFNADGPSFTPTPDIETDIEAVSETTNVEDHGGEDIWRDYSPVTGLEKDDETEQTAADTSDTDTGEVQDKHIAAQVDMAAMGIPVPAIPVGESDDQDNETQKAANETSEHEDQTVTAPAS